MKSSKIMKYFEQYVSNFDMNNGVVKMKYFHSLKSMDIARDIAINMGIFTEEEITLIEFIALFHDIGNFEQKSTFCMLEPREEDSTMKSIEVLFDEGLIRKITSDTKYDNIIKVAIYCHNKEGLPKKINEKAVYICNIIKDVHRLEELRLVTNYPYIDNRITSYPTDVVYNDFKLFRLMDSKVSENNADNILVYLSNIYGINYKYSYSLIKENNYIHKIINALSFGDDKVERFFRQIEVVLNTYIDKKIS